jgi:SOS response regulatory protein OraA/RecX
MHALTRRGMSVAEMTRLLEAREIDPDEIDAEIERLEGVGLLDDQALADTLVRTLQDRKGLGRSAVSAELRRRKIDQSAIDEALESIDTDDELTRAIEVATKRAGQLSSYDPETAKRRLGAYLMRRGYNGSILTQAMNAALTSGGPRFR